jgi:hypothetical protein
MVTRFGNQDWFRLIRLSKSSTPIEYYLDQLNLDEWYIYKMTNKFKIVNTEELIEFKFAGYILFNKKIYNDAEIDEWIEFYHEELKFGGGGSGGGYFSKPFPPKTLMKKIRIKQ